MKKCIVKNCKTTSYRKEDGVTFITFPKNPKMRDKWIKVLKLDEKIVKSTTTVCTKHFETNDFTNPNAKLKRVLPIVVPTKLINDDERTVATDKDEVQQIDVEVEEASSYSYLHENLSSESDKSVKLTDEKFVDGFSSCGKDLVTVEMEISENFIKVEEDEEFINSEFLPIEENEDDMQGIDTLKNVLTSELRSSYWHCGEILSSKNGNLILVCTFCEEYFHKIEDFNKHLDNHRSKSHKSNEDEKQSESQVSINSPAKALSLDNEEDEVGTSQLQSLDVVELRVTPVSGIVDNLDFHVKEEEAEEDEEVEDVDSTEKTVKRRKLKKTHKKNKRPSRNTNANLFCEICKKWFRTETTMNRHLMSCRATMEYNSIRFKTNENDTDEAPVSSGPVVFAEPLNINQCRFCPRTFRHNVERIEHECLHTGDKLYKCDECDKRFRTKNNYNKHEMTHKKIKPHKCHICDAAFTNQTNCKVHIRRHLGEKPYKCDFCEMSFVVNTERKHHQRQHTGEKPFQCNHCGEFFTTCSRLNSHLVKHRAERPFKCDECGKGCLTAAFLKDHKIVAHSGKRLECPICGVKVVRNANLKKHMLLHSDVKSYLCSICGKSFHQGTGLFIHMKTHSNKNSATK